jgi:uncharacterized membrane protein YoaK (UPF0700 family)
MPEILLSKKFQAALVGLIATIAIQVVPGLEEIDVRELLAPILAYILGQGLADFGKSKAKIEQDG